MLFNRCTDLHMGDSEAALCAAWDAGRVSTRLHRHGGASAGSLTFVSVVVQTNFHTDCRGMQAQLLGLSSLMSILDPQLTSFLVSPVHSHPLAPDERKIFLTDVEAQL